jgi:hypothetical protein
MDQGSQLYMAVGGSVGDIIGNNSARGDNGLLTLLSSDGGVRQYNHIAVVNSRQARHGIVRRMSRLHLSD